MEIYFLQYNQPFLLHKIIMCISVGGDGVSVYGEVLQVVL